MPDPFSAITGALGIIGFFAGTIEILVNKTNKFVECRERVRDHRHTLEYVKEMWDRWKSKRDLPAPRSPEALRRFWAQKAKDIEERLQSIEKHIDDITKRLKGIEGKHKLKPEQLQRLEELFEAGDTITASDIGFIQRFLVAIFKDDDIKSRLDTTKDALQQLEALSDWIFMLMQNLSPGDSPKFADIKEYVKLAEDAKECSLALSKAHEILGGEHGTCVSLLSADQNTSLCPVFDGGVKIELLSSNDFSLAFARQSICVQYAFHSGIDNLTRLLRQQSNRTDCIGPILSKDMRFVFYHISSQEGNKQREKRRHEHLPNRAQASFAVASWAIAAWQSD